MEIPNITTVLPQQVQEDEQEPSTSSNKTLKSSHANKSDTNDDSSVQTRHGLRFLFIGFRLLGVYFPKRGRFLYFLWSLFVNLYATIYLPTGLVVGIITHRDVAIGDMLTSLQVAIDVVGCAIKIVLMYFLLPQLLQCDPVLERLDKRCTSPEEKDLVRRFISHGNRFVILFGMAYWSYASSTCISAVLFHRLPYNLYNPLLDATASKGSFVLGVFVEMMPMYLACSQQVVDDSYAVIYTQILRTHLKALVFRLQHLNDDHRNENGVISPEAEERNIENLKLCIIDHKNIIELYTRVAPVISITLFVQFTITASLLGVTLINILIFATNTASIVASCFYVLAVVVEIFPLCYYAQCLMNENDHLTEAIFHSNWIHQSKRYRQMLIFFMQRSQKSIEFTAGKLFPITLSSFLSIAKFSFSLYTLIKEMDIKTHYGLD
ncbi:odorant receptor 42b-like [Musca domestica]|uniref:Odorant receptor n=1 Tax=Musca domestica TaxID=7370 RepID=A0A9J7DMR1_MUSDO|nr:odorant receptor 42b-like [Musca domestica]